MVRNNPDGSITVGLIAEEPIVKVEVKVEAPKEPKPKTSKKKTK